MRLKKIKGAFEAVAASPYCISRPAGQKGKWNAFFGNGHPIRLEIGMGKGQFLTTLARENPDISYLGIERYESVLFRAVQKMQDAPLENIRFLCVDALLLCDIFAPGEIDRIYLNFSDPWPKERHAKRRLTAAPFLKIYDEILSPDGQIEMKTDNRALFDFSMQTLPAFGFQILAHTYDLYNDATLSRGNVPTEYEQRFQSLGHPICKLIAARERTGNKSSLFA